MARRGAPRLVGYQPNELTDMTSSMALVVSNLATQEALALALMVTSLGGLSGRCGVVEQTAHPLSGMTNCPARAREAAGATAVPV